MENTPARRRMSNPQGFARVQKAPKLLLQIPNLSRIPTTNVDEKEFSFSQQKVNDLCQSRCGVQFKVTLGSRSRSLWNVGQGHFESKSRSLNPILGQVNINMKALERPYVNGCML